MTVVEPSATGQERAQPLRQYEHYIGGEWRVPLDGAYLTSIDPATEQPLYRFARGTEGDVDLAIGAATKALRGRAWRDLTPTRRGALLRRLSDLLGEHADRLAELESHDNGKLLREMRGQMRMVEEWVLYFAGLADKVEGRVIPVANPTILNYTVREPVGVVGAITPWNSPLLLTIFKLAPALAAGCAVVVKPSEHAPGSLLELAPLIGEAGFPPGIVSVVTGLGTEAGEPLVRHEDVARVAFTGSAEVGGHIASVAAGRFAGSVLELGGKSPNIVFADADVENAVNGIVAGIFAAAGQTCVAGSRVYLHEAVYEEAVERLTGRANAIAIGKPQEETTELGPLAFSEHRDRVERFVTEAVEEGATLLCGGARPTSPRHGYYFQPTVLADVSRGSRLDREEVFGPVVAIYRFRDEGEVLQAANDSDYALAAGIWTRNLARAHRMATRLEAGTVWVNTYRALSPASPFGGLKRSGMGKENGADAMLEYMRVKSIWINTDEGPFPDPFVLR